MEIKIHLSVGWPIEIAAIIQRRRRQGNQVILNKKKSAQQITHLIYTVQFATFQNYKKKTTTKITQRSIVYFNSPFWLGFWQVCASHYAQNYFFVGFHALFGCHSTIYTGYTHQNNWKEQSVHIIIFTHQLSKQNRNHREPSNLWILTTFTSFKYLDVEKALQTQSKLEQLRIVISIYSLIKMN